MHRPAPPVEHGTHLVHCDEVARHRGERGALRDVADVRGQVRLEVRRALHDIGRADQPADAPPGHRIGLGDAVEDHALVGELGHHRQDRVVLGIAVDEVLVDLVGDHHHPVLQRPAADGLDLVAGVDRPGRVGRRDEHQCLGARRTRRLELVDGHPEAGRLVGVEHDGHPAGEGDRFRVGGPVRRREQDLVALVDQHRERRVHRMLAAVGDHDLLRRRPTRRSRAGSWPQRPRAARGARRRACSGGCAGRGTPALPPRRWRAGSRSPAPRRRSR